VALFFVPAALVQIYSLLLLCYFLRQSNLWKPHHLTEPKTPVLHTSLRARPARVKSSLELEKEEIEKFPKFKARPLNKKVITIRRFLNQPFSLLLIVVAIVLK
jgi:hypothetical protein